MSDDPAALIAEIEDLLFPQRGFDVYERSMYYHLVRHTHLEGRESRMFPLSALSASLGMSEDRARKTIRSLEQKGCIELERSRKGHLVKVRTPQQLGVSAPDEPDESEDVEAIDFFSNRTYVESLLARENGRCFYCLASLKTETCVLDHVSAQVDGGGNSYRNIVAACHDCNSRKQGVPAEDHLRGLYRRNLLSESEFADRLQQLEALRAGQLIPDV